MASFESFLFGFSDSWICGATTEFYLDRDVIWSLCYSLFHNDNGDKSLLSTLHIATISVSVLPSECCLQGE